MIRGQMQVIHDSAKNGLSCYSPGLHLFEGKDFQKADSKNETLAVGGSESASRKCLPFPPQGVS